MLRFNYSESDGVQRWCLCGRLSGPWVDELRSLWQLVRGRAPGPRPLIDLREVTSIDEGGEKLLAEMQSAGAEFLAAGVEHKDLVANLNRDRKPALRRWMEHLCGGGR